MNKLLACTTTLLLLLGTGTTLADDRDGWNSHRGNPGFARDRHDKGRGLAWGRRDRDEHHWDDRHHDHDRDQVAVNLSFGNVWRPGYRDFDSFNTFGLGYSTFNTWGTPYDSWAYNKRRPLVVYQNTYIDSPAPSTRVLSTSRPRSGTSLLRDLNGRCFERETDRYGNETRTELPASACNF